MAALVNPNLYVYTHDDDVVVNVIKFLLSQCITVSPS